MTASSPRPPALSGSSCSSERGSVAENPLSDKDLLEGEDLLSIDDSTGEEALLSSKRSATSSTSSHKNTKRGSGRGLIYSTYHKSLKPLFIFVFEISPRVEKVRTFFLCLLPTLYIWLTPWLAYRVDSQGRHYRKYAIRPDAQIVYRTPSQQLLTDVEDRHLALREVRGICGPDKHVM